MVRVCDGCWEKKGGGGVVRVELESALLREFSPGLHPARLYVEGGASDRLFFCHGDGVPVSQLPVSPREERGIWLGMCPGNLASR